MAKKAAGRAKSPPGSERVIELNHAGRETALAFCQRGRLIASASEDRTVKLGDYLEGKLIAKQPKGDKMLRFEGVAISPDGYTVASVCKGDESREPSYHLFLWQPVPDRLTEAYRTNRLDWSVAPSCFSPDRPGTRREIAFWGAGRVSLLKVDGGRSERGLPEHGTLSLLSFSPDGRHLAGAASDGAIAVWDREGDGWQDLASRGGPLTALAFSPDGAAVATADAKAIRLRRFSDGRVLRTFDTDGAASYLAFLPDGSRLISFRDSEGAVRQWHVNGEEPRRWSPRGRRVCCAALSNDGRYIVTGGEDGEVVLWDRCKVFDDPDPAPAAQQRQAPAGSDGGENYFGQD